MPNPALPALIYMRDLACHDHLDLLCRRQRHRVVGIKHDPDGSLWLDVIEAALSGEYDVIVRCADLPCGRVPRVEMDPHPQTPAPPPSDPPGPVRPRSRRPRSAS